MTEAGTRGRAELGLGSSAPLCVDLALTRRLSEPVFCAQLLLGTELLHAARLRGSSWAVGWGGGGVLPGSGGGTE